MASTAAPLHGLKSDGLFHSLIGRLLFPGKGKGVVLRLADPYYAVKCFVESLMHPKSSSIRKSCFLSSVPTQMLIAETHSGFVRSKEQAPQHKTACMWILLNIFTFLRYDNCMPDTASLLVAMEEGGTGNSLHSKLVLS